MESPRSWMGPISLLETLRLVGEGKLQSSLVGKLRAEKLLRSRLVRRGTWKRLSCSSLGGTGEFVDTRRLSRGLRPWKTPAGRKSRTQPSRGRWFHLSGVEKPARGREPTSGWVQTALRLTVAFGITEKSDHSS